MGAVRLPVTYTSATLAMLTVTDMARPTSPEEVHLLEPSQPPDDVLEVAPNARRALQASEETFLWMRDAMWAVQTNEPQGPSMPLERRLKALSSDYKGLGVYMFTWWSRSCYRWLEATEPQRVADLRASVEQEWTNPS